MARLLAASLAVVLVAGAAAAQPGVVSGRVLDAESGSPLPGASVVVAGTVIGAATDLEGRFRIPGVPAGPQRLVAAYLGYGADTLAVTVPAGGSVALDFALRPAVLRGQEIVVMGQLEGQLAAINEQRAANTIVNVVSSDRLREYPDDNAAESVGRLPGVSVVRDGGEGAKVNVRGLAPSFTSITINGERIPSTDLRDRSVDLSLISSDLLAGIQLFKALTPDRDADAIGGTVNLVVREAPSGLRGRLRALGGYNALGGSFESARLDGSVSNRLLGDRLGFVLTANYQRTPRDFQGLDVDYDISSTRIAPRSLELSEQTETRTRAGASATLDYRLPNGGLQLRGLYTSTGRDEARARLRYRVGENDAERVYRERRRTVDLVSLGFSGEHAFPTFRVDYGASASRALNRLPEGFDIRFRQPNAFVGSTGGFDRLPLAAIQDSAALDLGRTFLRAIRREQERAFDSDRTATLNLAVPLQLGAHTALQLRSGAKYRGKERMQDVTRREILPADLRAFAVENGLPFRPGAGPTEGPAAAPFFRPGIGSPLFGRFPFYERVDAAAVRAFDRAIADRYRVHPFYDRGDYEAQEDVWAGYVMGELTAGPLLLVGGVRYEHTTTSFVGTTGNFPEDFQRLINTLDRNPSAFAGRDTTGAQRYGLFFPQVVARYRVSPYVDVRAAVTRSLARPDYLDLVAYENVDPINNRIERGNVDLRPTTAWNLDVGAAAYTAFGLLGAGAFYKRLTDFRYDTFFTESLEGQTYFVFQPRNGEEAVVYGVELEAQLNFTFLPRPLDGLLLTANYAYSYSRAQYPITYLVGLDGRTFRGIYAEDTRPGALPGQSPHIVNATLGYERAGFSARLSFAYQSAFLSRVTPSVFDSRFIRFVLDPAGSGNFLAVYDDPATPQVEGGPVTQAEVRLGEFSRDYLFVDLQVSQRVPRVRGLRVVLNASNLTDQPERQALGRERATFERTYGWTGQLGLQWSF